MKARTSRKHLLAPRLRALTAPNPHNATCGVSAAEQRARAEAWKQRPPGLESTSTNLFTSANAADATNDFDSHTVDVRSLASPPGN